MRCWRCYLLERSANSLHMVQLMPLPSHHVVVVVVVVVVLVVVVVVVVVTYLYLTSTQTDRTSLSPHVIRLSAQICTRLVARDATVTVYCWQYSFVNKTCDLRCATSTFFAVFILIIKFFTKNCQTQLNVLHKNVRLRTVQ